MLNHLTKIKVSAAAKLNLTLQITGICDKMHTLDMLCCAVDLHEHVMLTLNDSNKISIVCDHPDVPTDETNIAHKCALAFFMADGIKNGQKGLVIDIQKNIPIGAGMGGGSADGAAVLFGLNEMFGTPFTMSELCDIGLTVGSDIPVCLVGGFCRVKGTGGELSRPIFDDAVTRKLNSLSFLVTMSGKSVSTKEAYSAYDIQGSGILPCDTQESLLHLSKGDIDAFLASMRNDLEFSSALPLDTTKKELVELGAITTMMTGSGAAVFGVFEDDEKAQHIANKSDAKYFYVKPVDYGVKII